jgi:hypothetical protein
LDENSQINVKYISNIWHVVTFFDGLLLSSCRRKRLVHRFEKKQIIEIAYCAHIMTG